MDNCICTNQLLIGNKNKKKKKNNLNIEIFIVGSPRYSMKINHIEIRYMIEMVPP